MIDCFSFKKFFLILNKTLTMKNFILCIAFLFFTHHISTAQFTNKHSLSADVGIGLTNSIGDFNPFLGYGTAYNLALVKKVSKNFDLALEQNISIAEVVTGCNERSVSCATRGNNNFNLYMTSMKVRYKFSDYKWTPFVGLGLGGSVIRDPFFIEFRGERNVPDLFEQNINIPFEIGMAYSGELGIQYKNVLLVYSARFNGTTSEEGFFVPESQGLPIVFHQLNVSYNFSFDKLIKK